MVIYDILSSPYRYATEQDKQMEMQLLGVCTETELNAALNRCGLLEPAWWCYMPKGAKG